MKKVSLALTVLITSLIVSSCEPAKPGGGDIAPSNNYEGELQEQVEGKKDSSVEKALMEKQKAESDSIK